MPRHICIVSPHLDDALLSCGILMQRARAAGDKVSVLNIFSAGDDAIHGVTAQERQAEDRAAVEVLGGSAYFLDELDAPDRNPVYKSDIEIFFGALDPDDPAIETVARRMDAFFKLEKVDVAYVPLGAGTHIDHRITHEAAKRVQGTDIRYYEDRPYVLWTGNLQRRMKELCIDADLPAVDAQTLRRSIEGYQRLGHKLVAAEYEERCIKPYLTACEKPLCAGRSDTLQATVEEIETLYKALALYKSQMPYIYPTYDDFIAYNRIYESFNGGREDIYAERSWLLG